MCILLEGMSPQSRSAATIWQVVVGRRREIFRNYVLHSCVHGRSPRGEDAQNLTREIAMDLYYSPGACSLGIRVVLEEIGKPYALKKVSLPDGEQYKPEFLRINPKGKVATLVRDDGSVLTEFPAIATWLALINPEKDLLP